MDIVNTANAPRLPIPQDAWLLFQEDRLEIVRLNLAPSESMPAHENPWNIVFCVLEGSGRLRVEDLSFDMHSGDYCAVEAGKLRAWENSGEGILELLVIKSQVQ